MRDVLKSISKTFEKFDIWMISVPVLLIYSADVLANPLVDRDPVVKTPLFEVTCSPGSQALQCQEGWKAPGEESAAGLKRAADASLEGDQAPSRSARAADCDVLEGIAGQIAGIVVTGQDAEAALKTIIDANQHEEASELLRDVARDNSNFSNGGSYARIVEQFNASYAALCKIESLIP